MGGHAVECERCNEEGKMDDETDLEQNITGVERQGRRVPRASEVHHTQTAIVWLSSSAHLVVDSSELLASPEPTTFSST